MVNHVPQTHAIHEIPIPIETVLLTIYWQRIHKDLIRNFESSNQTHAKKLETLTLTQVSYKKTECTCVSRCVCVQMLPKTVVDQLQRAVINKRQQSLLNGNIVTCSLKCERRF